jgi:hypothetical protein
MDCKGIVLLPKVSSSMDKMDESINNSTTTPYFRLLFGVVGQTLLCFG